MECFNDLMHPVPGLRAFVRGNARRVQWRGESLKCSEITAELEAEGAVQLTREVMIRGKKWYHAKMHTNH